MLKVSFFSVMNRLFSNLRVKRVIEEVGSHLLLLSMPLPQALWSSQGLGLISTCWTSFSSCSAFLHCLFGSLLSLTSQSISCSPPLSWNENGWSLFCNSKVLGSLVVDQISDPIRFCPWILPGCRLCLTLPERSLNWTVTDIARKKCSSILSRKMKS